MTSLMTVFPASKRRPAGKNGLDRCEKLAFVTSYVADLHPERHIGVFGQNRLDRLECAVDVAERADVHRRRDEGVSQLPTRELPCLAQSRQARGGPPCPTR